MISTCHSPLRQPIVPKARPMSQTASAQPLTQPLGGLGACGGGEVEVVLQPAEHRVADRAADQGDLLAGRREAGAELVDHRRDPQQLARARSPARRSCAAGARAVGLVGHGRQLYASGPRRVSIAGVTRPAPARTPHAWPRLLPIAAGRGPRRCPAVPAPAARGAAAARGRDPARGHHRDADALGASRAAGAVTVTGEITNRSQRDLDRPQRLPAHLAAADRHRRRAGRGRRRPTADHRSAAG